MSDFADPPAHRPIASIHLVDTSAWTTVRRKAPDPVMVDGLASAHKVISAPMTGKHVASPQLARGGMIAFWEDEAALDEFLAVHPAAAPFHDGWSVRLEPLKYSGAWPGLPEAAADFGTPDDGPVAVLTIGNVIVSKFFGLQRHNVQIERQLLGAPGVLWGSAFAGPTRLLATLSVWESARAMADFARHGAHQSGIDASVVEGARRTPRPFVDGTQYFSEAAFIRFRPFGVAGSLGGRNPMPVDVLG